ncbi:MAG TPA: hypothetical protein VFC17_08145 [Candidatus Limnocylindrales bacterium]|nr:hypothetical protein [Candidatus Limnocylindrales bacterium]
MKPKQLANVLIKILGLSLCAHSVIPILNGLINLLQSQPYTGYSNRAGGWFYLATSLIPTAIGIFLIVQSRLVTEKLFKDEAE